MDSLHVAVSPNPSTGKIYVSFMQIDNSYKNIKVYDMYGNIIIEKTNSNNQVEFDLTNQAKGVYIIRIETNNTVIIKKIIII